MSKEKRNGVIANIIIYVLAFGIAFIPYYFISEFYCRFAAMFAFTMIATLFVLIPCEIFKNTSIYDPYWSVAPLVMAIIHMIRFSLYNVNSIIFVIIMAWYSFRLTRNWYITYKGIDSKYEDWRYSQFRNYPAWKFQIVNIFGLIYVPTLVVFLSLIPGLFLMELATFNPLIIIGLVIMVFGPVLEIIADYQVHKFISDTNDHSKICNYGLWNYSRHPNYLGELTFWFGIMVAFLCVRYDIWYMGIGFISMVILFMCASIPLMEKHNIQKRPLYKEYQKTTSMLLILPRKRK